MTALLAPKPEAAAVLAKSLLRAAKALGMTQEEAGRMIGRDRSALARGIDPRSKAGELALLFVRVYRALHVLVGGAGPDMRHWFATPNRHLNGTPRELVQSVQGLARVVEYLDAIRGKL
jgi:hypothetical protein